MSWQTILAIGSGGFIGAVLRSYLNGIINEKIPHGLPMGTLGVNLIGSLIMGILIALFLHTTYFSLHAKSFLTTGLLGALTTYSTFAIESVLLLQGGSYLYASINMFANMLGSVTFAALGFFTLSSFLKH